MVIETILRPLVESQTASARSTLISDHFEAVSGFANGVKEVHGKMVIETILRPLVDLQTASKMSNGYRDHFEAVSGVANGVSKVHSY